MPELASFLRRSVRLGTWPLMQRYGVFPRILDARAKPVSNESDFEVHTMVGEKHAIMLHWALHSFLHHTPRSVSVTIHDDGTCRRTTLERFATAFPGVRILIRRDVDGHMSRVLGKYPEMLTWWRHDFCALKWLDFYCFARADQIIFLDSDVLFFASPDQLFDEKYSAIWMRDAFYSLHLEPHEIKAAFGNDPPTLNSGLGRVPRAWFDVDIAHQVWVMVKDPTVQARAAERGLPHIDDQPIHAVLTAIHGGGAYLNEQYQVAIEPGIQRTIAKHYVNPQRFALYEEGVPRVARQLGLPLTRWMRERG